MGCIVAGLRLHRILEVVDQGEVRLGEVCECVVPAGAVVAVVARHGGRCCGAGVARLCGGIGLKEHRPVIFKMMTKFAGLARKVYPDLR